MFVKRLAVVAMLGAVLVLVIVGRQERTMLVRLLLPTG